MLFCDVMLDMRIICNFCDESDHIVTWASEEFSIPYISPLDNKRHRYYPDFLIKVKEPDGKFKKYVVNGLSPEFDFFSNFYTSWKIVSYNPYAICTSPRSSKLMRKQKLVFATTEFGKSSLRE